MLLDLSIGVFFNSELHQTVSPLWSGEKDDSGEFISSGDSTVCAELYDPKKIKVGDLDFATLFEPRIEEGRIFFNRRRAVIMDVAALGALRQQLIDMLGEELAMGALSRFGYAHSCSDAMMLGESFSWETETDWLAAGPSLHTLEGIVHVTPQKIEGIHIL